jgi:hypothetical protein
MPQNITYPYPKMQEKKNFICEIQYFLSFDSSGQKWTGGR